MVSVNIPDELWIPFLQQSVGMQKAASERIRDFVKLELKQKEVKE